MLHFTIIFSYFSFVLVDDTFWIDITGVDGYEEAYATILDSFKIEER